MKSNGIIILFLALLLASCGKKEQPLVAPWGDTISSETVVDDEDFDLDEIERTGELIALTISGPDTYYDYHGRTMGLHASLCQMFADSLGVKLRIELCADTAEIARRLANDEADLAAYPMTQPDANWPGWRISEDKPVLIAAVKSWYNASRLDKVRQDEQLLSQRRVQRRVHSPLLNRKGGVISRYDELFRRYSQMAKLDWRMMAAQCYQESTFDPKARSWAGACGLMQIMPSTADHLGLNRDLLFDPEENIAAAAKYLAELDGSFTDISNRRERQNFVLAAYNGGAHHIRDAMALARQNGRNPYDWSHVEYYVVRLSDPAYYHNPVVKYGYMRGTETADYVNSILRRYKQYRGVKSIPASSAPQKSRNARHRNKFRV